MACNINGKSLNLADCFVLKPGGKTVAETYDQPTDLVNIIVPNLFVLAGIFLFLMFVFAGFKFAMKGAKGKDDAKGILQNVIVGFLVMFGAYWIVKIIEMLTGVTIFL